MEQLTSFWVRTKPHMVWVVTAAVVVLYASGWALHYFTSWQWLAATLSQAATAVLVSGVFASLLKSYQFTELFKKELTDFFTASDMIAKIREIAIFGRTGDDVLHKAMEHMLTVHSHDLSHKFSKSAKNLLRIKHEYSLRNLVREITLVGYNAATGTIKIRDDLSLALSVNANTNFSLGGFGPAFTATGDYVTKLTMAANGDPAKCMRSHLKTEEGSVRAAFPVLAGTDYRFHRVWDHEFQLRLDPILQQEFVRFCDGMTLRVINEVPDQLDFAVRFLNFAEQLQPEILPSPTGTVQKTYTNDYLTFPLQAFIVTITQKHQGESNETKH
jgi:hypothetical protein